VGGGGGSGGGVGLGVWGGGGCGGGGVRGEGGRRGWGGDVGGRCSKESVCEGRRLIMPLQSCIREEIHQLKCIHCTLT